MEQRSPIVSYKRSSEGRGEGRGEEVRSKEKKRGERELRKTGQEACVCVQVVGNEGAADILL